jgi:hypothetical protein
MNNLTKCFVGVCLAISSVACCVTVMDCYQAIAMVAEMRRNDAKKTAEVATAKPVSAPTDEPPIPRSQIETPSRESISVQMAEGGELRPTPVPAARLESPDHQDDPPWIKERLAAHRSRDLRAEKRPCGHSPYYFPMSCKTCQELNEKEFGPATELKSVLGPN